MKDKAFSILLADDDKDDCNFFKKALEGIQLFTKLTIIHDGEELMKYLEKNTAHLPDVLFLDLSMPRKTGFECLTEIKSNLKLMNLPITIFTTSFARGMEFELGLENTLSKIGAEAYIRKPGNIVELKNIIQKVISRIQQKCTL